MPSKAEDRTGRMYINELDKTSQSSGGLNLCICSCDMVCRCVYNKILEVELNDEKIAFVKLIVSHLYSVITLFT